MISDAPQSSADVLDAMKAGAALYRGNEQIELWLPNGKIFEVPRAIFENLLSENRISSGAGTPIGRYLLI